jgi:hypothetical protein
MRDAVHQALGGRDNRATTERAPSEASPSRSSEPDPAPPDASPHTDESAPRAATELASETSSSDEVVLDIENPPLPDIENPPFPDGVKHSDVRDAEVDEESR